MFAGTMTVNSSVTLPPPGMVKLDHAGEVAPTAAFDVDGRVAPPPSVTVGVAELLRNDTGCESAGRTSEIARLGRRRGRRRSTRRSGRSPARPGRTEIGPAVTVCLVTVSCGRQRAPAIAPALSPDAVTVPCTPEEPLVGAVRGAAGRVVGGVGIAVRAPADVDRRRAGGVRDPAAAAAAAAVRDVAGEERVAAAAAARVHRQRADARRPARSRARCRRRRRRPRRRCSPGRARARRRRRSCRCR